MPEDENVPPTPPTPDETPEKFSDEWYTSVEQRFEDLGEFIRSGKATHAATTEPPTTPTPAPAGQGQPTSHEAPDGATGTVTVRDTRPPKPNHFWFRRLGE
jgi:hypothetical protein